jgi:hypothetical protein
VDDLNPRHRTVFNTSANTVICINAYQPYPPPRRKTAVTGRLRKNYLFADSDTGGHRAVDVLVDRGRQSAAASTVALPH